MGDRRSMMRQIVGLLALCFAVGLVLKFFDITPQSIITDTLGTLHAIYRIGADFVGWAVPYTLLGAVIVVPIAAISFVLNRKRS